MMSKSEVKIIGEPALDIENNKRTQAQVFAQATTQLAVIGRYFHSRGWALGTGGNFSSVVTREPLHLAVTATGVDKGLLDAEHIVLINGDGKVIEGKGQASNEAILHLTLVRLCGAGVVLHTHSVCNTVLSDLYASDGGIRIEGYEMLKGLEGVRTHEHQEWLPILENSQELVALSQTVEQTIECHPDIHGFLLRRHGLYTWGRDLKTAKRHVEIFEFLLEVLAKAESLKRVGL